MKNILTTVATVFLVIECFAGPSGDRVAFGFGSIIGWTLIIVIAAFVIKSFLGKRDKN